MNCPQVLAFLLCESVVSGSGTKPTLHGIFDSVQFPNTEGDGAPFLFPSRIKSAQQENKPFFVFYKVRLFQSCSLELKVLDPLGQEIAKWSDNWESGGPIAQSAWAVTFGQLRKKGIYTFELWDDKAHRLAYTELNVIRM